ncbi:uncharacterized protein FA14DRAFT_160854 [Meira miltonrushii]|uniref:Uncharacterized protein n=1 Tax=Meira miltonrushii TaxID=1280837 RepID=A0A316VE68_9BASI|nr:uncharacterized protein FA14DRAFT_160854 [Meira miltonrushii]PWN35872.1 hypothetical protein FA14DRAFT_160854 [Meira miltonrushii]
MRGLILFIILAIFFKHLHVLASSDERDEKPAEEQHKIINDSLSQLNHVLAEGRRRQANHANIGKTSEKNAEVALKKINALGEEMKEIKEKYDKHIDKWTAEGPSKNAAVPNKGERPLHLTASHSMREARQLHKHWIDSSNWPSPKWSKDRIAHQHASAKEVSSIAISQMHTSQVKEKKRRASIS